jgi:drug/metabolite transporter (DMT)-like permease
VGLQILALAGGQILWKRGIADAGGFMSQGDSLVTSLGRLAVNPIFLAGSALYVVATLLWFYLLARYELSFIYPFVSLTFIVASVAGWLVFGEAMSVQRMAGILVVAAGIVLVARS